MPLKKGDASEGEGDKFSWTPENERKLFLFMIGTTSFSKEDTERLAEHAFKGNCIPVPNFAFTLITLHIGTSANAIKQRANKIRIEHRALYEEHGWPTPDGKPAVKAAGTPKKKRAADGDVAPSTPAKKGKKGKAADDEPPSNDLGGAIKAEESEI
ncbi:uncharacterized protein N0V89_005543 [Didymosphaeria variabile]|uniref:Uncharacterized protein n=1 Tax=Didymosphaeria variabile TaxID=1932322 RepID=A0A9W9CBU5_9PLEO|nr:uncharacterized protein N0V89_005543 [Didymosphaeria variabile]KAJ4353813.1 hypothetical protein N0V89_005543 [Didymosphaeria variabile]